MNKAILTFLTASVLLFGCSVQNVDRFVKEKDVERVISTLSADEMRGRQVFTPGIEEAGRFIEKEFKTIGLLPLEGEKNLRQEFLMTKVLPKTVNVRINGELVDPVSVLVLSDKASLDWGGNSNVHLEYISPGQSFMERYQLIMRQERDMLVYVDPQFSDFFKRLRLHFNKPRVVDVPRENNVVFVLGNKDTVETFDVKATNSISQARLMNIVGIIPGKSKKQEKVIFSAHYDHIGVLDAVEGDSIANGADDDASGVTAVISLARYFSKINQNERTLVFVAFTAEEIGGVGSQYFSRQLDPDDITAMFNIEMIGKESKFGKNTAFITGFDKSDFGSILQQSVEGTPFRFYPDPYPDQNLFYRSDNATLAAQGVPAHTISTNQIDVDPYYHTVNDELKTLSLGNVTATIKAIALGAKSIVEGDATPTRLKKLER